MSASSELINVKEYSMKSFMEFLLESNEEDEQLDERVFAPKDFFSKPRDAYF